MEQPTGRPEPTMWIRDYRQRYGLSRAALGKLAECSGELIYIVEAGGITHPRIADRIASVCGADRNARNGIVDGAHWRAGWKQIPKYRDRGAKAEKMYFLMLAREADKEGAPVGATRGEDTAYRSPVAAAAQPGQPTERERRRADATTGKQPVAASGKVYSIGRKGHIIGTYADCAAAARQYAVQRRTVEARCEHRIGNTDEYFVSGVTFRYAAEWDGLDDDARLERAIEAAYTKHKRRNRAPTPDKYTWQGQTHSMSEWARIARMNKQTLQSRLASGWDIERALKTPVRGREH